MPRIDAMLTIEPSMEQWPAVVAAELVATGIARTNIAVLR